MITGSLERVNLNRMRESITAAIASKRFITVEIQKTNGDYRKLNGIVDSISPTYFTIKDRLSDGSNEGFRRINFNRILKLTADNRVLVPNYV